MPVPNIGKRFETLKYWAGVMKIMSMLNSTNPTINIFIFIIADNPSLLAHIIPTIKNSIIYVIGVFCKKIFWSESEKFLITSALTYMKSAQNTKETIFLNMLPPKYSEISRMSFPVKFFCSLQTNNTKNIAIIDMTITFNQDDEPPVSIKSFGVFKIILFIITIIINPIASIVPILVTVFNLR